MLQDELDRRAFWLDVTAQCSCALSPRGRGKVTEAGVDLAYQK